MKLELRGIRCELKDFQLRVDEEITSGCAAFFGASGAGKTTLIEIIAGLRRPSAGRVALNGTVFSDSSSQAWVPPQERRLGYVPQDLCLFPHLTVEQNIRFAERFTAPAKLENAQIELKRLLEALEIENLLMRMPHDISGGEKQRVALARALRMKPELLLLDEPFANLDQPLRKRLVPYLKRIQDTFGTAMIYVSHDADEVAALANDVVIFQAGKVISHGPPTALFEQISEMQHVPRNN